MKIPKKGDLPITMMRPMMMLVAEIPSLEDKANFRLGTVSGAEGQFNSMTEIYFDCCNYLIGCYVLRASSHKSEVHTHNN